MGALPVRSESSGYQYIMHLMTQYLETDAWLGNFAFSGGNPSNTSMVNLALTAAKMTRMGHRDWIKIALPNRLVLDSVGNHPG